MKSLFDLIYKPYFINNGVEYQVGDFFQTPGSTFEILEILDDGGWVKYRNTRTLMDFTIRPRDFATLTKVSK